MYKEREIHLLSLEEIQSLSPVDVARCLHHSIRRHHYVGYIYKDKDNESKKSTYNYLINRSMYYYKGDKFSSQDVKRYVFDMTINKDYAFFMWRHCKEGKTFIECNLELLKQALPLAIYVEDKQKMSAIVDIVGGWENIKLAIMKYFVDSYKIRPFLVGDYYWFNLSPPHVLNQEYYNSLEVKKFKKLGFFGEKIR